jgi:hypothetical protein
MILSVALAAIGYAIWRLLHAEQSDSYGALQRALNQDEGRMKLATGARGLAVDVDDPGGGHTRRTVGRGVIRR